MALCTLAASAVHEQGKQQVKNHKHAHTDENAGDLVGETHSSHRSQVKEIVDGEGGRLHKALARECVGSVVTRGGVVAKGRGKKCAERCTCCGVESKRLAKRCTHGGAIHFF